MSSSRHRGYGPVVTWTVLATGLALEIASIVLAVSSRAARRYPFQLLVIVVPLLFPSARP
jgi:hypothetical protein